MEEHEMRIHPLFENMKIAASIFGLQNPSFRQVVWRGGTSCYREHSGRWTETPCQLGWRDLIVKLETSIALSPGESVDDVNHGLGADMRRRLEALGYVR
jgi:hypothetical protein